MKKIMTVIAAVAIVASAQASSFSWKTTSAGKLFLAGTTTELASGTAYLFDSAAVTQQAVLTAVLGGSSLDSLTSLSSSSVTEGAIASQDFNWGNAGDTLNAFVALVDGDNVFISDLKQAAAQASSKAAVNFNLKSDSQGAAVNSPTFSNGGWYTISAVPEPTSGLLMLVGLAGLALRRRRA